MPALNKRARTIPAPFSFAPVLPQDFAILAFLMRTFFLFGVMAAFLSLAPASARASDNSFWGTAVGASLGGYLGSTIGKGSGRLAATGAGVFLGGAIGNGIGSSMDRADAAYARSGFYAPSYPSYYRAYEPNYVAPDDPPPPRIVYVQPQIVEYRTIETPVYMEGAPIGPQPPEPERHCREFTQTIKIDGQVHESYGTACLRPDGSWQIQP